LKYFFDNCIAPSLAKAISALGQDVIHLRDKFAPDTPDEIWLPAMASEGRHVVTCEADLYKRTDQRKILRDARLVCFVLPKTFASHGFWEQAKYIVSYWPKIRDVAATEAEPGQFWLLQLNGKIELGLL